VGGGSALRVGMDFLSKEVGFRKTIQTGEKRKGGDGRQGKGVICN